MALNLNLNLMSKRIRVACEIVSPQHKFPKLIYKEMADYVLEFARITGIAGDSIAIQEEEGARVAFYLSANAALYSSPLQMPSPDAHKRLTNEELHKLRDIFGKLINQVAGDFKNGRFSIKVDLDATAKDFVRNASQDVNFLAGYKGVFEALGETCVYSEWLSLFLEMEDRADSRTPSG